MPLIDSIQAQIEQNGPIPFVELMQQALYSPQFGYYSAGLQKFGKEGDFITAPELTPLFAQTIANQCQQIMNTLPNSEIFEFGAGSGRLAVDLLKALELQNCLPKAYQILEVSANLRHRQEALIRQEIPHLLPLFTWQERWPEVAFSGIIIANEVLDAMPVHRFLQSSEGICESFIGLDEKGNLVEIYKPVSNPRLQQHVEKCVPKELVPYQSEVNLFIQDWLKESSKMLKQGAMFIFDYGFPRGEYYHPDRNTGTLMCHYRHHSHPDPLIHLGEQDITAHVDFTEVAEAGYEAGFHVAGYCNQASFLLANGLLSFLHSIRDEKERISAQQAVRQLTEPQEMGELFKVIALTKHIDFDLTGFQLQDKRASL